MKQNIKPIPAVKDVPANQDFGEVLEAENGEALTVLVGNGNSVRKAVVTAHASEVPSLQTGDRVVVLNTDENAIITHRLRNPGERPQAGFNVNPDGSLSVRTTGGIVLATDHATIEVRADGSIFVDGKEIYAIADGLQRLQGSTIELN